MRGSSTRGRQTGFETGFLIVKPGHVWS